MLWSSSPTTHRLPLLLGQQADKPVLGVVGVLVLVHHQVAEPVLVVLQHVGAGLEQAHGVDDEVVKVHGVGIGQAALVDPVGLGHLLQAEVVPGAGARSPPAW